MTKPEKILYTATAKSTGGRDGTSASDDGRLSVTLSTPKSLGGNDGPGTNPEQMFAAGYSACFIGAMKFVAMTNKIKLPDGFFVEAKVGIGPIPGGFGLKVDMNVSLKGMSSEQANDIVQKAHGVCPYSNATRNNIEVNFNVHT
ncbi:MAG: organic hydroperoxide resistance protein [Bdellovibrionales bacterium]|nr:organic hydroperoxide resistance protein [Bdellovibrionales bacterium]